MTLDASAILALGTLCAAILGAITTYVKIKPEAESIATKTTLEVNESLRQERAEARQEAHELREKLRDRDEEIDHLQRKVTAMRQSLESLEAEVNALRNKTAETRRELDKG